MPRKKIRTTTEVVRTEETSNPIARHVRDFLESGVFPDELQELQFKIDVQKYNREGKPVRIVNAIFDNLQELPDRLGNRFGAGRFRLFVSVMDDTGKKVAFVRVEDFEVESGDAAAGADQEDQGDQGNGRATAMDLQMLKMQQDHEMLVRMMDQNTKIVIAALSQKSGGPGGGSLQTLLQAVKIGRDMATGLMPDGDDDAPGRDGDAPDGAGGVMGLLENPIVQQIVTGILKAGSTPAVPAPAPAAVAPGQSPT